MSNRPLVSIIMATFNAAPTLEQALTSIAAQTYSEWELVVCDDASTDRSVEVLRGFADAHPGRVKVLANEVNSKLAFSLNRCLAVARGDLVARMDADDVCRPERLERQVRFLAAHPDIAVVGTAMQRFDNSGLKDVLLLPERPTQEAMRHGVPFAHATIVGRRSMFDVLGGYTVARRTERGQDYDLWFRFFHAGLKGCNLLEALYLVREDRAAIRRRTFRARLNAYRTTLYGFRLLGFPRRWYVAPTLGLLKGFLPTRFALAYRRWENGRYQRVHAAAGRAP